MQGNNDLTSFEQFCKRIELDLQKQLSYLNATAELQTITKNNNTKNTCILIREPEKGNMSPSIPLQPYYELYLAGLPLVHVEHEIMRSYSVTHFNTDSFTKWENISGKIVYQIINYEMNKELLEAVPHRRFLDFAVTYYCRMDRVPNFEEEFATIQITNEHLLIWGKEEAELFAVAEKNTPFLLKYELTSMADVLAENPFLREEAKKCPMYVLTNRQNFRGSVCIMYPELLKELADSAGCDFYILPASVHDVIIMPAVFDNFGEELADMVKHINKAELERKEILSDNVYLYSRETDEISICMG